MPHDSPPVLDYGNPPPKGPRQPHHPARVSLIYVSGLLWLGALCFIWGASEDRFMLAALSVAYFPLTQLGLVDSYTDLFPVAVVIWTVMLIAVTFTPLRRLSIRTHALFVTGWCIIGFVMLFLVAP